MRRIYLDSNILISYFATDKAEETKTKLVTDALVVFSQLKDLRLCTSIWGDHRNGEHFNFSEKDAYRECRRNRESINE